MVYREIIAVCSEMHTKHINTLCGQNVELSNVKLAVHKVLRLEKVHDICGEAAQSLWRNCFKLLCQTSSTYITRNPVYNGEQSGRWRFRYRQVAL